MDSLSSEVGHKMRSAVKAKLIELGSGSSAGYIDDELPDYVMIMVANKRSKTQMTDDLKLFLGKNTETFVNWLHQVLEKLQEVTLPASVIQKSKRKNSESADKKDKKSTKRKPKQDNNKTATENTTERSTTPPLQTTSGTMTIATASITDVFADHFMQRAKKSLERVDSLNIKTKKEFIAQNSKQGETTDGFDIPTISEIAKNAVGEVVRRKELTELEELQKKINQAKRQLKEMAAEESEDEDFINLKAEGDDLGTEYPNENVSTTNNRNEDTSNQTEMVRKSHRVQITFEENSWECPERITDNTPPLPPVTDSDTVAGNKRPVLERLGIKPLTNENVISLSAHRRVEQAIYVPAFRRNEAQKKEEQQRSRDRSRERETRKSRERESHLSRERDSRLSRERDSRLSRERDSRISRDTARDTRDLRDRVRERGRSRPVPSRELSREKDNEYGSKTERQSTKMSVTQRIGSRIIVAPPKPDYIEDNIEVPVSSVVKVKPRPIIPKNKQASKNLLLRAVAEAQKSTARPPVRISKSPEQLKRLYTKSYLNKRGTGNNRIIKDNIVVQVETTKKSDSPKKQALYTENDEVVEEVEEIDEDEYVPSSDRNESGKSFIYVPQQVTASYASVEEDLNECSPHKVDTSKRTQFVVTMDAKDYRGKKRQNGENKEASTEDSRSILTKRLRLDKSKTDRVSSPLRVDIGQKVNKLIIQNDTEDEEELRKEVENSKRTTHARKRTPIKFDNDNELSRKRSQSRERKNSPVEKRSKRHSDTENNNSDAKRSESNKKDSQSESNKVKISKSAGERKYDNLPPLSSAITIGESKTPKKERCKFYPSCGKGERCEYVHPSSPCKTFPNCKFGDSCLYIHPKCKFDLTCSRLNCNYTHTPVSSAAPPLSSHVVPVSNYKKIVPSLLPALCKFYPNCSNTLCDFYHPKPCKFGKSCTNKIECNFYHFDLPSMPSKNRLKWVASAF